MRRTAGVMGARVAAWATAAMLAALAGISRAYLGMHWTTDVIGGRTFGILWLAVVVTGWTTLTHSREQHLAGPVRSPAPAQVAADVGQQDAARRTGTTTRRNPVRASRAPPVSNSTASHGSAGTVAPASARAVMPAEPSGLIMMTIQLPPRGVHTSVWVPVPAACAVQMPAVAGGAGADAPGWPVVAPGSLPKVVTDVYWTPAR